METDETAEQKEDFAEPSLSSTGGHADEQQRPPDSDSDYSTIRGKVS